MSVDYSAYVKMKRMQVVRDNIDAGGSAGKLKIYTKDYDALLVEIILSYPASEVNGSVLNFLNLPKSGRSINSGLASVAAITDSNDNVIIEGLTVGLAEADIILDNISIAVGQTVHFNYGMIMHG